VKVLGLDPGATTGWCVYDTERGWLAAGEERWFGCPTAASLLLLWKEHGCDIIAIEEPFVRGGSGPASWAVGETKGVWGVIVGMAYSSGIECVSVPAGDWQSALTGKSRGTRGMSKLVNRALGKLGLLPKQSNQHKRDACGIARHAAMTYAARRVA
jgi:hypothetical protein